MKSLVIFLSLIFVGLFSSCGSKLQLATSTNSILGKWKLTESLIDIGDGKGTWTKAEMNHYVKFNNDSTIESNLYTDLKQYRLADSVTLIFVREDLSELKYRYAIKDSGLELNPPCIEACGSRFIRVDD